jgi:uncharacterized protein GlcG (DUF336 family)
MIATLNLETAELIATAALAAARAAKLQPLTVIVLDAGGHYIVLKREDGCGFFRQKTARAKAYGALGLGKGTRFLFDLHGRNPAFVSAMIAAVDGDMFPSPGGILIRNAEGLLLGAIGVSGDVGDRDEEVALAGIKAAKLLGDTGAAAGT